MADEIKTEAPRDSASSISSSSSGGGKSKAGLIIIIVLVVVVILGVAGYAVSKYVGRKIGENLTEGIFSAATGGKVDVNTKDNSVKISDESGSMELGSSTWPSSMPSEVPKYTGGKITYSSAETTNKIWSVGFEEVPTNAYDTYKSALTGAGWTVSSETDIGLVKTGIFEKGSWTLNFSVDPESKGATLGVTENQ